MALKVIHYPHPILRHVSKPLKRVDRELRGMIGEMFDLMYKHEGVGLAANQVDLPYRLFVANPTGDANKKDQEFAFINPVILSGKGQVEGEEGCLSIPGLEEIVERPAKVRVEARDPEGEPIEMEADELLARALQHEIDHLDGILFLDRVSALKRRMLLKKWKKLEAEKQEEKQKV